MVNKREGERSDKTRRRFSSCSINTGTGLLMDELVLQCCVQTPSASGVALGKAHWVHQREWKGNGAPAVMHLNCCINAVFQSM